MVKKSYYSVQNILNFAVIDKTSIINRLMDKFEVHYANFKVEDEPGNLDMIFEIGKFKPKLSNTYNVGDGKYYFGQDYLYVPHEQCKGAKWRFEIEGIEASTTYIRISCNPLGRIFIVGNVIDFLIHFKLTEMGYPMIHASSLCKNNKAILFSTRGGGGKTTIALHLVEHGFGFLGDNFTILHKSTALSFPTSLSIFTYNLAPIIKNNLTQKQKIELQIKHLIYRMTKGYAKFFTKLNPRRVINNMCEKAKIEKMFIIFPRTDVIEPKIIETKKEEILDHLVYNQMLEFPLFNRYIYEYSYFFPDSPLSRHWETYKRRLNENLDNSTKYYKAIVPTRINIYTIEKLLEVINDGAN
ncbi:hypothetical protein E3E23_09245 [Thermococcus sp. CX2]|uniref:hypothetical protein n=1 Tax=Thermococcus sp. CX2 TaxID=163006 RepID=UPI00143C39F2|nr:hypothetical protein [Thermococcus sp. CX2]NJE86006.1 hypothetical protein [Thermococcus sp. CX2]